MKSLIDISFFKPANLLDILKSQEFTKAILMIISLVVPVVFGVYFEMLKVGIFMSLGCILVSPNDVFGNFRLKLTSMLLSIILIMGVSFIGFMLQDNLWITLPVLGILFFVISYFSVYGFRASLISFSGLFALVLSFSSLSDAEIPVFYQVLLIGAGGLWYIFLSFLRHLIFPKGPTEHYLTETIKLTGDYLKTRGLLMDTTNDREQHLKELLDYQTKLTENHENLRELLINRRKNFGKSSYQARRLLIFIQLVEILELSMANPVNYYKADKVFEAYPEMLQHFQKVLFELDKELKKIAQSLSNPRKFQKDNRLKTLLEDIKARIPAQEQDPDDDTPLLFINYWKYQHNQVAKVDEIIRLLKSRSVKINFPPQKDFKYILSKGDYRFSELIDNFTLRSSVFRHAIKLAITAMVGYVVGVLLNVENAYWILLTLIVIMRPSFGLTKSRFKQRTIGTVIGGGAAFVLIMLTQNTTVYGIVGMLTFVIGFSMIQRNYKAAAAFITIHVLTIYALLRPDAVIYVQFRVMDTLIGAGLAYGANLLLLPSWEIKNIDKTLIETMAANKKYLDEIAKYYNHKGDLPNSYKLSRKQAFLAFSDLSSSFQRMTQEPKRQRKNMNEVFKLVMLHNSFISALASLGTYIIHNPTTPASQGFNKVIAQIQDNLSRAEDMLEKRIHSKKASEENEWKPAAINYKPVLNRADEIEPTATAALQLQEAHLVFEQLKWLLDMSERIPRVLNQIITKIPEREPQSALS